MECKINKIYLLKWYELILEGASADIECDIEDIEARVEKKSSLFYTGKLSSDEMVIKRGLLNEIKDAVRKPLLLAQDNYQRVMRKHGIELDILQEELASMGEQEDAKINNPIASSIQKESVSVPHIAQLELF